MNTASLTASRDVFMPTNFNPRSPRGERRVLGTNPGEFVIFQSTFPAQGTAYKYLTELVMVLFQSTSPRGERRYTWLCFCAIWIFQSTSPRGKRPGGRAELDQSANFNPRPRTGNDRRRLCKSSTKVHLELTHLLISVHHPRKQHLTA